MSTWTTGEPSVRQVLIQLLALPVAVGGQLGIVPDQWTKLKAGQPVVLERAQLQQFGHSQMPANLAAYAQWTLTGENALTPVV